MTSSEDKEAIDVLKAMNSTLSDNCERYMDEARTLSMEKDTLSREKDTLSMEKDALNDKIQVSHNTCSPCSYIQ